MKRALLLLLPLVAVLGIPTTGEAQNTDPSLIRVFELPRFISPPILDGVRGDEEWAGSLELPCSPTIDQCRKEPSSAGPTRKTASAW